jgi:hypothetical protein
MAQSDTCPICFKQFESGDILIQYAVHGNNTPPQIAHMRCVMIISTPEKKPEETESARTAIRAD